MIPHFLSPLSVTCSFRPNRQYSEPHLFTPILCPKNSSVTPKFCNYRKINGVVAPRCSNSNDPKGSNKFVDVNGAVDDMDGYLNYLSLEYDSVWDTKPAWCQPWTITLTGVLAIASSWLVLHSVVVTTLVIALIATWWYIFLYSYPKGYSDMIAERRKKVANGAEDTFGLRKSR